MLPFQLRGAGGREPVGGVHLDRLAILEQRGVELTLLLELMRGADVLLRRGLHGAFQGDLVLGAVGVVLDRLLKVRDRFVPVADAGRLFTLSEGAPRGTAGRCRECCRQNDDQEPLLRHARSYFTHS